MPGRRHESTGFSLVELLTVLAIIALLVAMFAPAIPRARQKALQVQCANNLRQIGAALVMYDQTYKRLPDLGGDRLAVLKKIVDPGPPVRVEVMLLGGSAYPDQLIAMKAATKALFNCPAHQMDDEGPGFPSYAPNVFYSGAPITKGKGSWILGAEVDGPFGHGSHLAHRDSETPGEIAPRRHGMKSNYLFFDGHVDWLTYLEASGPELVNWGVDQRKREPIEVDAEIPE